MRTVLVAPIGDHPVVVTAAVDKLTELGTTITDVDLIHTTHPLVKQGAEWIELFLDNCEVRCYSLTSGDVNSQEAAKEYLQTLTAILLSCEQVGDEVHMLLSGGRKNMSALTAVVAGFFSCIKGLYHILDKHENNPQKHNFFTIEELNHFPNEILASKMHPPLETTNLFSIPFPRFNEIEAKEIRDYLLDPSSDIPDVLLHAGSEALSFYREVFQNHGSDQLEVRFTEQALQRFNNLWKNNRALAEELRSWFKLMQNPEHLRAGIHGTFSQPGATFHFFKRRRTAERPFFYTQPNPVHLYPEKEVSSLVLHGFSKEQGNGAYEPTVEQLLIDSNIEPRYQLIDLPRAERAPTILIAPLGDTSMVASQAYMLLKQFIKVTHMVLLYPAENQKIRNAAEDLVSDFQKEKLDCVCQPIPIAGLADVDSTNACNVYLKTVAETIDTLRKEYPHHEIHLLLSGGRKSMAALNFFAGQYAQLPRVWHTLVKSSALEEKIRQSLERNKSNSIARRDILFLQTYAPENFDIFEVPVIPLRIQAQSV